MRRGDPGRPEICPIFALHGHFSPKDVARVEATCRTGELGCVDCKTLLADHLIDYFGPFRERRAELAAPRVSSSRLSDRAASGAARRAQATLGRVRAAMHMA